MYQCHRIISLVKKYFTEYFTHNSQKGVTVQTSSNSLILSAVLDVPVLLVPQVVAAAAACCITAVPRVWHCYMECGMEQGQAIPSHTSGGFSLLMRHLRK